MKIFLFICFLYLICAMGYALLYSAEVTPLDEAERYNKYLAEEMIKKEMVQHEAWKYLDELDQNK